MKQNNPDISPICSSSHQTFQANCKGCRHIQAIWYDYLSRTGFQDIEINSISLDPTQPLSRKKDFQADVSFFATFEYYNKASQALNSHQFKSTKEQIIWHCHALGFPNPRIAQILDLDRSVVTRKINKLQSIIKIEIK